MQYAYISFSPSKKIQVLGCMFAIHTNILDNLIYNWVFKKPWKKHIYITTPIFSITKYSLFWEKNPPHPLPHLQFDECRVDFRYIFPNKGSTGA